MSRKTPTVRINQALLENRTKRLLLLREREPQYKDPYHIGIMWERHNRRMRWCFVYRVDGSPMFPHQWYDEVRHFSNGYAAVREGDKWHYINEKGKIACPHRFLEVSNVDCNGWAFVKHQNYWDIEAKAPAWIFFNIKRWVVAL